MAKEFAGTARGESLMTVAAVADTPTLTTTAASGDEDTAIALDISSALADLDGQIAEAEAARGQKA